MSVEHSSEIPPHGNIPESLETKKDEILDPHHFYAAYVFDQPETREKDITTLLEQAQQLGYRVRYWWLSDAMELQGFPDRLILCVHHPTVAEDAGIDLYETLKEKGVSWNELEAAVVDEYRDLGKPAKELGDLRSPLGNWLFPHAVPEEKRLSYPEGALLLITREDVRDELQGRLGRELTEEELSAVIVYFKKALDYLDWTFYLDEALNMSVEARQMRWDEKLKTRIPVWETCFTSMSGCLSVLQRLTSLVKSPEFKFYFV